MKQNKLFKKGGVIINNQSTLFDYIKKPKAVKDKSIPKGISLKSKEYWCPYCSTKVIFQRDKKIGIKKCPICGISEKDYWVKKVNNLK